MDLSTKKEFDELSYYTLEHYNKSCFIHQHIIDAFQAQTADSNTKPISLTFAFIGLYLYLDKMYTGREVQQAHLQLAHHKQPWTMLDLPEERGIITVSDVLKAEP